MKTECLYEGNHTALSASEAVSTGFLAVFDLQLFNESQELVRTVDGKVTLDFTQPVEPGAWHDIVDENGNVYGTIRVNMNEESNVHLASPPKGVSPIEAVVYSPTQAVQLTIYDSKYLEKSVTCKATNGRIWLCYGEAFTSDKKVFVYAAPNQVAEAVYLHDDKGDCWATSFKNGQIGLANGSYAILPNGTKVVGPRGEVGLLTADSEGRAHK